MMPHPDCVPCLMKRVLFQARLLDNGTEMAAVKAGLKTYAAGIDGADNSARLATQVHRAAYDAMGVEDSYLELKIRADRVAAEYVGQAEDLVRSSDDRFSAAVRVSIIGNVMDFGSGIALDDPDDFGKVFSDLLAQGIGSDQTAELRKCVDAADSVIYIFDNCGEDQFDRILIREIGDMGKRVIGVARGAPILNDVTVCDAKRIGLDADLDELMTTNAFAIGIDMDRIGDDLRKEMSGNAVIIAKGMANYESLSDERIPIPVAYLLRAKCIPVAGSLGVSVGTNVVRVCDQSRHQ